MKQNFSSAGRTCHWAEVLTKAKSGCPRCSEVLVHEKENQRLEINSTDKKYLFSYCSYCSILFIQVYAPTSNAEEAEVERFYEDLQDLLELALKKMSFSL